jgi:hypothetical protein
MPIPGTTELKWRLRVKAKSNENGPIRWPAKDTEKRILLLAPPFETNPGVCQYVRVLDKSLQPMEQFINMQIDLSKYRLNEISNSAIKALHPVRDPGSLRSER